MTKFTLFILQFIICLYTINNACFAKGHLDKELINSLYCANKFRYFEMKYAIPKDLLYAISLKETGRQHSKHNIKIVWPWSVNIGGQSYYFPQKHEAVYFVKHQIKQGKKNIDVGCMQINLKHHPNAFKSIEHAFDPKINVAYGASFLRSKYEQHQNWHKAIANYHSATKYLSTKYKNDVLNIVQYMPQYKKNILEYASTNNLTYLPNIKYYKYKTRVMSNKYRYKSKFMTHVRNYNKFNKYYRNNVYIK